MKKISRILFVCLILVSGIKDLYGQYKDITRDLGITHTYVNNSHIGGGVAIVDINNDGWLDMVFTGGESPDRLFLNLGDGQFSDNSEALIKPKDDNITSAVVSGDFNNDGCADLYFNVYNRSEADFILVNDCNGRFSIKELNLSFGNGIGATLFDFNKDGLLDIYSIGYVEVPNPVTDEQDRIIAYDHTCGQNTLLLNQGDLEFVDVTESYGAEGLGCSLAVTVIPLPEQETHGIYIANDFGEFLHPNQLLVFQDDSLFVDEAPIFEVDKRMYGMGIAIGDYDNDLDLDLYVSNLGENIFYQNESSIYTEVQSDLNVDNTNTPDGQLATSWGTFFLDADNDTDLDLFVANGFLFTPEFIGTSFIDPNQLFLNESGDYIQTTADYGIAIRGAGINRGAAMGDLDNDGDLDIVISYINFEETSHQQLIYRIYDNVSGTDNNYIKIRLRATSSAPDAFGSQVILHSGAKSWMSYHYSSATHCSQNAPEVHFGLGDFETIDSIQIIWPTYEKTVHKNIPINNTILITENKDDIDVYGCSDENSPSFSALTTIDIFCEPGMMTTSTVDVFDDQLIIATSHSSFTIDYNGEANAMFELFDVTGKRIFVKQLSKELQHNALTIPDLVPGMYVWTIIQEGKVSADLFFLY